MGMADKELWIEDAIPKETRELLEKHHDDFEKTGIPKCLFCEKPMKQVDDHGFTWEPTCRCMGGNLRLCIG